VRAHEFVTEAVLVDWALVCFVELGCLVLGGVICGTGEG
jgi:hypothetical protein